MGEFPDSPVVRTPSFHCCGPGFHPWSGNLRSHKTRGRAKKKSQHLHSILSKATSLTLEGGRLKRTPQLIHGRDYELVPEPVWRALYHWYGANLALPRPVSTASIALYKQHL